MSDIHKIHDLFFKLMFAYYPVHRAFTRIWLYDWVIDFKLVVDSMKLVQSEMVNKIFGISFPDLIFEIKSLSKDEVVYFLLEHKSSVDKNIREQLDRYIGNAKSLYHSSYPKKGLAVGIKPVVLYHGRGKWNIPLTLEISCYDHNKGHTCIPVEYKLIDLARIPDEQILGPAILRIVLLSLKYVRSEEFPSKLDSILVLFKELKKDPYLPDYVNIFTHYVDKAAKKKLRGQLVDRIVAYLGKGGEEMFEGKSRVMQILEKQVMQRVMEESRIEGWNKGRKEGREEGREEGVDKGAFAAYLILNTDKPDETIARETKLPTEKIRELRKKLRAH